MLDEKAKKFIEKNKDLLQNDNFQEFFNGCEWPMSVDIAKFFMLDCGINFLEYMTYISDFFFMSHIKSLDIPNSITEIGGCAFSDCKFLQDISIPNSVTKIGDGIFNNCRKLESVILPNSISEISEGMFYDCRSLKEIIIPKSIKVINNDAFFGCSSLESIIIPNSVTDIGYYVFEGCKSLKEIELPEKFKYNLDKISINTKQTKVSFI